MTPLDSRIDEDYVCRLYRGEPFAFEGQLEDADGAVEDLAGRIFWGCIMAADGTRLHEVVAEILTDRGRPYYRGVFHGTMTDARFGQSGLLWSQGEYIEEVGRRIHAQGPLVIYPGPGADAPEGASGVTTIAHRIIRRETANGRAELRISQRGARGATGPGPWEKEGITYEAWKALNITDPVAGGLQEIDGATLAALQVMADVTASGDFADVQAARARAAADAVPEVIDARDTVRVDADRAEVAAGQASGRVTVKLAEVVSAGGSQLLGYGGSTASMIPIVTDAAGKVRLAIDPAAGKLLGDFDIVGQLNSFFQQNVASRGSGAQVYVGASSTVPVLVDAAGKVSLAIDALTGKLLGDFGVDGQLDAFYQQNVVARGGGAAVWTGNATDVPILADAVGRVFLSINKGTGKLGGAFDVASNIRSFEATTISPPAVGLHTFTGASAIVPIIADAAGKTLMAVNKETGAVSIAGLDLGSVATALQYNARKSLDAAFRFALNASTIYGVVIYSQSLGLGAQGNPPLSTVQRYSNLTFAAGPKTTLTDNGFLGTNQSAMDTAKGLVEDSLTPDGSSGRGETILSGMLNGAVELAAVENAIDPANLVFFGSTAGHGGWSIDELKPGYVEAGATVNWYQNFLDHVTRQHAIALAAGKAYVCVAIPWLQLEADSGQSKDWYKPRATALFAQLQADVVAITGQTTKPHIICYQPPYGVKNGTAGGTQPGAGPHRALLELATENVDIHLVPLDGLPYFTDNVHLTNVGYLWAGWRFARVLKDIVVDGVEPEAIMPISAVVRGNLVKVKFSVPLGPLVIDAVQLAAAQDAGFKVTSVVGGSTVTSTVTAAYIENGDTLVLSLAAEPGTSVKVRCGMDYQGAGLTITAGAMSNLRDSYPGTFRKAGVSYPLFNVAPHFTLDALILDAGA